MSFVIEATKVSEPYLGQEMPLRQAKGERIDTPFVVDGDLQANPLTSGKLCLEAFLAKGGSLVNLNPFEKDPERFFLQPLSSVYPSCSAGFCRSQTLWAVLSKYNCHIHLFPPHATRYGCDPYNGRVNWQDVVLEKDLNDEFEAWSGKKKAVRFGFDNFSVWKEIEGNPTSEKLAEITAHYDDKYFGPRSVPLPKSENTSTQKRVYITFAVNTHAHMFRLNQCNERLDDVTIVHIDLDDLVTHPLPEWNTYPRSAESYAKLAELIERVIDCSCMGW